MAVWAAIKLATDPLTPPLCLQDGPAGAGGRPGGAARRLQSRTVGATLQGGRGRSPVTPPDAPPETGTETGDTVRLQMNVVLGLRLMA